MRVAVSVEQVANTPCQGKCCHMWRRVERGWRSGGTADEALCSRRLYYNTSRCTLCHRAGPDSGGRDWRVGRMISDMFGT